MEQPDRSHQARNGTAEWVTRYTWPRGIPYRYLQRKAAQSMNADAEAAGNSTPMTADAHEGDLCRQYRW